MNRCTHRGPRWLAALVLAIGCLAASVTSPVAAQGFVREAPAGVQRALLSVTAPPEITLDGKPDRLSPGARIRGVNTMLVLSGSIVGQSLPVLYRRDSAGLVHDVWILTAQEDARLSGLAGNDPRFIDLLRQIWAAR